MTGPAEPTLTSVRVAENADDGGWWVRATLDVPGRGEFAALFEFADRAEAESFADDRPVVEFAAIVELERHDALSGGLS